MDIQYLLWLQGLREAAGSGVEAAVAAFSDFSIGAVAMLIPLAIFWAFDKRTGHLVMFSFGLGNFVNQTLKNIVCAYRPWLRSAEVRPAAAALEGATGYSFPSGHTQTVTSVFGGVGWSLRKRWPWVAVVCFAFVALVAGSRNFLGVHTPQDVAVGLLEGALSIAVAGALLAWVDASPRRDAVVLAVGLAAAAVMLACMTLKGYPADLAADGSALVDPADMITDCYKSAGMFAGMLVGWFAERRTVGFATEDASWPQRVVRIVVGAVFTLVFYVALKGVFVALLGAWWGGFARSFCTFVAAIWLAPLVFSRIECRRDAARTGAA